MLLILVCFEDNYEALTDQDYINLALEHGVSKETLDIFCSHPNAGKQSLVSSNALNIICGCWSQWQNFKGF